MDLAPIILFVYNRPEHTAKTINALKNNELASESSLIIYSDGFKDEITKNSVLEVRKLIKNISGFKNIKIVEREKNYGLANSVIYGVTEVINEYGKIIVLEDDIVTSKYFLKFMNEALEFYKKNDKIFSISGYTFRIKFPTHYKENIFLSLRSSSWGWSTWKNRWAKINWSPQQVFDIYNKDLLRGLMDKAGKDLAPMLLKSVENKINSWAIKWIFTQLESNSYTLYPIKSLAKNIGADATGTNFIRITKKYDVDILYKSYDFCFTEELEFLPQIQNEINKIVKPGILSYLKYRLFNIY
jgi:hypothetical protein